MQTKKNKLLAYILSVLLPGLGHIYIGLPKRGLQFLGFYLLLILVQVFAGLPSSFTLVLKLASIILWFWSLVDIYNKMSHLEDLQNKSNLISPDIQPKPSGLMSSIGFKNKEEFRTPITEIINKENVPGEQLIDYSISSTNPSMWYLFLSPIVWALNRKNYMLCLTNNRLLVIRLNSANKPESYNAYPTAELKCLKDSKFLFQRNLPLLFPDGHKQKFSFVNSKRAINNWGN